MLQARAPSLAVTPAGAAFAGPVPAAALAVVADYDIPTVLIIDTTRRPPGPVPCLPPLEEIVP